MEDKKKYKIIIDNKPHDWQERLISGAQIKRLAGVDLTYGVWQQLPGPDDPEIGDTQQVDLSIPGRERFFTGKKTTTEGLWWNVRAA